MKKCVKCGESSENFGKHKHTKDGFASWCNFCKNKQTREHRKELHQTKRGHLSRILAQRKSEAKKQNIPFDLDLDYLFNIANDVCPILNIRLSWGERKGKATDNSPSLDKFNPKLGYIKGNVTWISFKANTIKNNATSEEIQAVANWMQNITNATTTQCPACSN